MRHRSRRGLAARGQGLLGATVAVLLAMTCTTEAAPPPRPPSASPTTQATRATAAATPGRDDEAAEVIDPVVATPTAKTAGAALVGKLHPLSVHLPIGWLLLLVLVEFAGLGWPQARAAGLPLAALTLFAFLPAIATGLLRAASYTPGTGATDAQTHRNLMLGALTLLALALGVRVTKEFSQRRLGRGLYLGLVATSCGLMVLGSHLGAKLVYGAHYLPF